MSEEEEEFLKAIRLNPADDTARLVYADWLDEIGDERMPCPNCKGLKVGDLVKGKPDNPLVSGSGWHADAVVVSLNPFNIVSVAGDMRWFATQDASTVERIGVVDNYKQSAAHQRWVVDNTRRTSDDCPTCEGTGTVLSTVNSDRAEYIRLQCDLWRYPKQANWLVQMPVEQWKGDAEEGKLLRRLAPLVKRNTELEKLHVRDCATWSRKFMNSLFGTGWLNLSTGWQWFWSRGFISEIHLPTADFFSHAAKIFALQPITRVRFTDKDHWTEEGQEVLPENDRSFCWWDRTPCRVEQDGPFDPGNIPTELFDIMWRDNPANRCEDSMSPEEGRWLRWHEPEIPQEELSAAGVEWGRKAAGLPPLRSCPSSMV